MRQAASWARGSHRARGCAAHASSDIYVDLETPSSGRDTADSVSTKDTASTGPAPTFQEVCTTRGGPPLPVPRHRRGAPPRPRAPPPKCHVIAGRAPAPPRPRAPPPKYHVIAGRAPAPLGVAPLQHTMVPCHFADCFLSRTLFLRGSNASSGGSVFVTTAVSMLVS